MVQGYYIRIYGQDSTEVGYRTDIVEGVGFLCNYLLFPFYVPRFSGESQPYLETKKNAKREIVFSWEDYKEVAGKDILAVNNAIRVISGKSKIVIEGNYRHYTVTDISGRRRDRLDVPAGIYVVNVDGEIHKVMVR